MQIDFKLYHRNDLLTVRATLADDCLSGGGGGAARVEEVLPTGKTRRLGTVKRTKGLSEAERAAHDAVLEICRVAAALTGKPWPQDPKPERHWAWPKWALAQPRTVPWTTDDALRLAALWWSWAQEEHHEQNHPTGPSDESVYRKEAQLPWR